MLVRGVATVHQDGGEAVRRGGGTDSKCKELLEERLALCPRQWPQDLQPTGARP